MIFRPEQHSYFLLLIQDVINSPINASHRPSQISFLLLSMVHKGLLQCLSYYFYPGSHLCQHAQLLFIAHTRGSTFTNDSSFTTYNYKLLASVFSVIRLSDASISISLFPQFHTMALPTKTMQPLCHDFISVFTITMPLSGHNNNYLKF